MKILAMWPFKKRPKTDPITFHSIVAMPEGGVRLDLGWSPTLQFVVEAMKDLLEKKEAPNYVETILTDKKTGRQWGMLVRRLDGLTPAMANAQLQTRIKELDLLIETAEEEIQARDVRMAELERENTILTTQRNEYREAISSLEVHGTRGVVDGWVCVPEVEWDQAFAPLDRH